MKLFISFAITSIVLLLFIVTGIYLLALAICRRFLVVPVGQRRAGPLQEKIRPEDTRFDDCIYTTQCPPSIILHIDEEPPEYYDIEANRASPLPSYDSVIYNDNLQRSFQSFIGKTL